MIHDFFKSHPMLVTLMLVALLAASGYLRFRFGRGAFGAGGSSWILALLILCLLLSGLPTSGAIGLLFLTVAFALGIAGIVYIFKKQKAREN